MGTLSELFGIDKPSNWIFEKRLGKQVAFELLEVPENQKASRAFWSQRNSCLEKAFEETHQEAHLTAFRKFNRLRLRGWIRKINDRL